MHGKPVHIYTGYALNENITTHTVAVLEYNLHYDNGGMGAYYILSVYILFSTYWDA